MEISSPSSMWKEYNVAALPLNEYALSIKTEYGATVKEYYFDGYITVDGFVRAYTKIYEHASPKGVILYMPDTDGDADDALVRDLIGYGYTVAVVDYLGKSDKHARYTLYPPSLDLCNSRGFTEFEMSDDTSFSRWYIWTCVARRAALLLKKLYGGKLFALGVGLGGSTVYKLSAFEGELDACATLLNIIPNVRGEGNRIINYHASLENSAYASISKVPMFMAVCSNAEDGSLDGMSELAEATESLICFRIIGRSFIGGIKTIYPEIDRFFENPVPGPTPRIHASNSEGNMYLNITVDGTDNMTETYGVRLFVAFCIEEAPYRNWMNLPLIGLGNNSFIAHVNVCRSDKPIYAYANITTSSGVTRSSALLEVMPKTLNLKARQGVNHRKIYDGSMGEDGWTSRDGGKIQRVKGPFDIDGVTSTSHSIVTLKLGDPLFKVTADTLLQLMICGKAQQINVMVSDKNTKYTCPISLNGTEDWQTFSLAHINFKSSNGPLSDWSQILMLEFEFEESFVIGSVLWV